MPTPDDDPQDIADHNAAAIASLRRRRNRVRALFWFFILLMPFGCACPCALAVAVPKGTPQTVAGVTAFVLPLVGFGGMLLMLMDRSRYGRRLALAELADDLGLRFIEHPPAEANNYLTGLQIYASADIHIGATNLMTGKLDAAGLDIMDFAYAVGLGRYRTVYEQTVVVLYGGAPGVPDFVLYPRTWVDKLSSWFGGRSLELPGEEDFNRQFVLQGGDDVEAFFTPDVVDLCLSDRQLTAEVQGGTLAVHHLGVCAQPQGCRDLIKLARRLAGALLAARGH